MNMDNRKKNLTLDLNKPLTRVQKFNQSLQQPVLGSPDLHMLKLASPELEKMILNTNALETPTPGLFHNKVPLVPGGELSEAAIEFGKGFDEALSNLHKNENHTQNMLPAQSTSNMTALTKSENTSISTMSGGGITYTNLDGSLMQIKEEPQITNNNSPQMSPIDMESQEKIKLERKRQRNRVAASKCRKRKLERISKLEDRVKILKVESTELGNVIVNLKKHVAELKKEVIAHVENGCCLTNIT